MKKDTLFGLRLLEKSNGFAYVWKNIGQNIIPEVFYKRLRLRLQDQHNQVFRSPLYNDDVRQGTASKLRTYRVFKNDYKMENYLTCVKDFRYRRALAKLRLSNHQLRIEIGRYKNENIQNRVCIFCNSG